MSYTWKESVLRDWLLYHVDWVRFLNRVFSIFYILIDFLLSSQHFPRGDKALCYNYRVICPLFVNFFLIHFEASLLGGHKFRIILSSWWSDPFLILKCPSLSLPKLLVLKFNFIWYCCDCTSYFWLVFAQSISHLCFQPFCVYIQFFSLAAYSFFFNVVW